VITIADTNVRVIVDAIDNASDVLKNIGNSIENSLGKTAQTNVGGLGGAINTAVGTFGKLAIGVGVAGIAINSTIAVVEKLAEGFNELMQASEAQQRVDAQTNAVLQSTGDISGATLQSVQKLADTIENSTPILHTNAQAAENMLLTFTSIGHTELPTATKAVIDMATAMNGGLIPSQQQLIDTSIQVGKALNDPDIGLLNLRRDGVEFSDAQKQVIEQLVATGQGAKAQQLILDELNKEFGGSAQAALATYGGAVQNLQNKMTDLKEVIGDALSPALTMAANQMSGQASAGAINLQQNLQNLQAAAIVTVSYFEELGNAIVAAFNAAEAGFQGDIGGMISAVQGGVQNAQNIITTAQNTIMDNTLRMEAQQQAAAENSSNGAAVAISANSQKAQKAMEDETATYLRELAKRNEAFQQSLDDMIRSHLDKKNQLMQQIADENSNFQDAMDQEKQSFADTMESMVSAHQDKVDSINEQIQDEKDTFEQAMQSELDTFNQTMSNMQDAHDQKVETLTRQMDKERQVGNEANDAKYLDLKQALDDENTAYAKQVQQQQAQEDKKLADMKTADQEKLTQFQSELDKEQEAYQDSVDKATQAEAQKTQKLQEQHDKQIANYQDQLNQENALLNAHQSEVAQAEKDANDDEITRLEKTHAQENADALAQHLQKMKDIPAQQADEGTAGATALTNSWVPLYQKMLNTMYTAQQEADIKQEMEAEDTGKTQGQNYVEGFINGISNKINDISKATHIPAGVVISALGPIAQIAAGLSGIFKQAGGVVPGPIGAPVPIVAHGGEYVTPAGQSPRGMNGQGGGGSIVFNVNVGMYAGAETEKRNLARQLYAALLQVAQSQHKTVAEMMGG